MQLIAMERSIRLIRPNEVQECPAVLLSLERTTDKLLLWQPDRSGSFHARVLPLARADAVLADNEPVDNIIDFVIWPNEEFPNATEINLALEKHKLPVLPVGPEKFYGYSITVKQAQARRAAFAKAMVCLTEFRTELAFLAEHGSLPPMTPRE